MAGSERMTTVETGSTVHGALTGGWPVRACSAEGQRVEGSTAATVVRRTAFDAKRWIVVGEYVPTIVRGLLSYPFRVFFSFVSSCPTSTIDSFLMSTRQVR